MLEGRRVSHTSLCGNDSDIMPLLLLTVQLHHRADEARVRGNAEQRLGIRLRINGVPEIEKADKGQDKERGGDRGERISVRVSDGVREWMIEGMSE